MADVSASATVQSLTRIFWLYRHCVDLQNATDTRYREFAVAIRGLDEAVTRLRTIVEQSSLLHDRSHESGVQRYNPELAARVVDISKDFKATLMDCEILLANNAHFQTDPANLPPKLVWSESSQTEVNLLQHRLAFQTHQVWLLLSSTSWDEGRNVTEQVLNVARNQDFNHKHQDLSIEPFRISKKLVFKFRQASWRDPPSGFKSPEDFPLDQGFVALSGHLQLCTTLSPPGTCQTAHQYLSLLKAQWILQCMKQLPSFKLMPVWGEDKIDAQSFENAIATELTRGDLTKWNHEDIARLPDNHFLIWDVRPISTLQDPTTAFRGEKKILYMPAGGSGYDLVVFRILKDPSGVRMRLVRRPTASNPELRFAAETLLLDAFKDKLIPFYAFPWTSNERWSLGLKISGHAEISPYEFDNKQDLFKLQWALTCYTVVSDFAKVNWAIARRGPSRSPSGEASRVQIWLWDPHNRLPEAASAAGSQADSDGRSLVSHLTGHSTLTILQDAEPSHVSVSARSQTEYSNTEVVEAVMPYEPLIVMYAKHAGRYCFLSLELGGEIFIDPTNCDCSKRQGKCRRVVFKSQSGRLTVKRVAARTADPEGMPNLNVFARSFRKGQAAHPQLNDEQTVEELTGGHIALDFASVELRQAFNKHFALARKLRRSIESTDSFLESHARFISDQPTGRGNPADRIAPVSGTAARTVSNASTHSDGTPQQNRSSMSSCSASIDSRRRSSVVDHRHDSTMFPSPASSVPRITQPSELEDRNSSPTEVDGRSVPWHNQRVFSNQRSSNDFENPHPGGGTHMPLSREPGSFQAPSEPGAFCQPSGYSMPPSLSSDRLDQQLNRQGRHVYELS